MSSRSRVAVTRSKRGLFTARFLTLLAALMSLVVAPGSTSASHVGTRPAIDAKIIAPEPLAVRHERAGDEQVEPGAGNWHTWVLASGSQIVPPAPPDKKATRDEIAVLRKLAKERDPAVLERIAFWNSGAPVYRWNEMAIAELVANGANSMMAGRNLALVNAAMSDATVAAWNAKYRYDRPRPTEFDSSLDAAIDVPASPSYPAEHAVAAGAASEVLAYLFPARADYFRGKAVEAANAFANAGVNYPSDIEAGLALGRQVAALVIERGKADGSDVAWGGTIPTGPGKWTGQNPALPQAANWKPWVLSSPSEFRPGPPPAYDSAQLAAEMDELRKYERTPKSNSFAQFWEWAAGGTRNYWFWNQQLSSKLFEYGLSNNPPRAARAYALQNIAYHDAVVACWDAKYTYWAFRPFHLDPAFKTLFTTPNHPSYPSAHSCLSGASADVLAYLFPYDSDGFKKLADEAGEARIWAGLHFRSDITSGLNLAHQVAGKVISVARADDQVETQTRTGVPKNESRLEENARIAGGSAKR